MSSFRQPQPTFGGRLDLSAYVYSSSAGKTKIAASPLGDAREKVAQIIESQIVAKFSPNRRTSQRTPREHSSSQSLEPPKLEQRLANDDDNESPYYILKAGETVSQSPWKRMFASNLADLVPSEEAPPKRRKGSRPVGYAPPEQFAQLNLLKDIIAPNLLIVFVGSNPGIQTAMRGHAYAHPGNKFWQILYESGITSRQLKPEEDRTLLTDWDCGNTNIVERPTSHVGQLCSSEQDAGIPILEAKIRNYRPELVCIVGKGIWDKFRKVTWGKGWQNMAFEYGWQDNVRIGAVEEGDDRWEGAKVFVAYSTSGRSALPVYPVKLAMLRQVGSWIQRRRVERVANNEASIGEGG